MEQLQQRVSRLEQDVANLKRAEAESSFSSRDLAYKSDLAQAMLKVLHEDVRHIKSSIIDTKEDIKYLKLKGDGQNKRLDQHGEMLRQILGLLTPPVPRIREFSFRAIASTCANELGKVLRNDEL